MHHLKLTMYEKFSSVWAKLSASRSKLFSRSHPWRHVFFSPTFASCFSLHKNSFSDIHFWTARWSSRVNRFVCRLKTEKKVENINFYFYCNFPIHLKLTFFVQKHKNTTSNYCNFFAKATQYQFELLKSCEVFPVNYKRIIFNCNQCLFSEKF